MPLPDAAPPAEKRMGFLLGTWVYGEVRHASRETARAALDAGFDEIKRLEGLMSRFRPGSEVSRINRDAEAGQVFVSPDVFDILWKSADLARRTQGALDVTVAPLVDLWKSAEKTQREPPASRIRRCLARTGWQFLKLDPARRTVRFLKKGMGLDLGAVGKGYILDCAAETMKRNGAGRGMLDAGGNILVWGPQRSAIGIRNPVRATEIVGTVCLKNEAVATSAGDERFFEIAGRRHCHILDPRSGRPSATDILSVSVVASSAWAAEALSTPIFILGTDKGLGLASEFAARELVVFKKSGSGFLLDRAVRKKLE